MTPDQDGMNSEAMGMSDCRPVWKVWEYLKMSTARPNRIRAHGRSAAPFQAGLFTAVICSVMALSWLIMPSAQAQDAANSLQDIEIRALPGNRIELRLILSAPAPTPLAFTIDKPARIALDLADTSLALDSRRRDVGIGILDTILAAEAGGRTRVVLNLDVLVPYETRVDGNSIFITLGEGAKSEAVVAEFVDTTPAAESSSVAAPAGRRLTAIDFRRSDTGAGRVIIGLSDSTMPVDVRQEGDSIVVNFAGAQIPKSLMKRLDVMDFATPVNTIDAMQVAGNARIVIASTGPFEELAYQSDEVFTIEVQPIADELSVSHPTLFDPEREYSGERLTLNFQDIETRAVLQLLADISGRNIVVSDTVQGNVTLRLQSVPWDQALDIVLATKGLDMRENGNVIIVAPSEEIAARELADLESKREIKELEPLSSEFLQVNYAKASDLADLIQGDGANSLLSERGSVGIDDRTNTLLLQDTSDRISNIRRLVVTLDIPVKQVLIEARIVVVNDDFSRELGVRWGATVVKDNSSDGLISISGSAEGNDTIVQSGIDNINTTGQPFPITVPGLDDRFNVNLPVPNPAGQLAVAILGDDYLVDLELSALQAEGRGEVISSPRVITANQKEAEIKQGVEIPYQESASSGATTTQFKEAVLSLTVTPQITPDDRIIMDLLVTKDSVGEVVASTTGFVPSIDTRSVQTQVLVNNGQTVVLGGIYETEQGESYTKVPYLGDIPFIGNLFKSTRIISNKSELLIFVTPKILKEGSSIY
jgi:type IV pilus assembly protein PilQ